MPTARVERARATRRRADDLATRSTLDRAARDLATRARSNDARAFERRWTRDD